MRKEDLYRAMEGIEDELLEESERKLRPQSFTYRRVLFTAALMGACALIVTVLPRIRMSGSAQDSVQTEAAAVEEKEDTGGYAAVNSVAENRDAYYGYMEEEASLNALETLYTNTFRLIDSQDGNIVVSPLNIGFALSLLGEITSGDAQAEILQALGAGDTKELRKMNTVLYAANNVRTEELTSLTGNSFWLSDQYEYNEDTLAVLQDVYRADAFTGRPGTAEFDALLRDWLNEHTGHLLESSVDGVHLSEDTVLALASALYYKAAWTDGFHETDETTVFHAPDGDEEARFMKRIDDGVIIHQGRTYSAVELSLYQSGSMWIFLPEEGYTVSDVLKDEGIMDVIRGRVPYERQESVRLHITMPEFDAGSELSLKDELPKLGVSKVLGSDADFSGITAGPLTLSEVRHAARVITDEDGVTGAAYTVMIAEGAAVQNEYRDVYFTVDRPFVFAVTGADGSLLFIGTVNHPQ